jgi:hypothetical protein
LEKAAGMNLLRWLLVVPAACLGFVLSVVCGFGLVSLAGWFCPPELVVSGLCTASWYPFASDLAICVSAALGASVTVALPFLLAPTHRLPVAITAFAGGSLFALWILVDGGSSLMFPVASALAGGLLMAVLVLRGAKIANATRSSP